MGSGSSRSGRALRRLRSPDSRPAGPGGAAPEGGTGLPVSATAAAAREEAREAAAEAAEGADGAGPGPGPAAPPDGGDETLRLLDQLLAESAAWGPGELAPRGPARPRPAAGAGSPVSVGARGAGGAAAPVRAPEPPPRRPAPRALSLRGHRPVALSPSPRGRPAALSLLTPFPSLPPPGAGLTASNLGGDSAGSSLKRQGDRHPLAETHLPGLLLARACLFFLLELWLLPA